MKTERTEVVWEIRRPDGYKVRGSIYEHVIQREFKRVVKYAINYRLIRITREITETTEDVTPEMREGL